MSSVVLTDLASPQLITIQGNTSFPGKTILNCVSSCGVGGYGFISILWGTGDITFQGFTLTTTSPSAYTGLSLGYDYSFVNYVHVSGFPLGVAVCCRGAVNTVNLVVSGCSSICVDVAFMAYAEIDYAVLSGVGSGTGTGLAAVASFVLAEYVSYSNLGTGFSCTPGSYVMTAGPTYSFTNVGTHINCNNYG